MAPVKSIGAIDTVSSIAAILSRAQHEMIINAGWTTRSSNAGGDVELMESSGAACAATSRVVFARLTGLARGGYKRRVCRGHVKSNITAVSVGSIWLASYSTKSARAANWPRRVGVGAIQGGKRNMLRAGPTVSAASAAEAADGTYANDGSVRDPSIVSDNNAQEILADAVNSVAGR